MRIVFSAVVFLALLFCSSCDDKTSSNPAGSSANDTTGVFLYQGVWNIVLSGDLTGGGDMDIGSDGKFSDTWTMNLSSFSYSTLIVGSLQASGSIAGDISISGNKVGTFSGTFSGNSGSGTYHLSQPEALNGTFTATKK
jgi:hypothetical protein